MRDNCNYRASKNSLFGCSGALKMDCKTENCGTRFAFCEQQQGLLQGPGTWLGSLRVRRFTGADPWVGFPALPRRMFAAVGCVAGESPNVFSGRFRASDDF